MKKLIAISVIVAGTFSGAGIVSAAEITSSGYDSWVVAAFEGNN